MSYSYEIRLNFLCKKNTMCVGIRVIHETGINVLNNERFDRTVFFSKVSKYSTIILFFKVTSETYVSI